MVPLGRLIPSLFLRGAAPQAIPCSRTPLAGRLRRPLAADARTAGPRAAARRGRRGAAWCPCPARLHGVRDKKRNGARPPHGGPLMRGPHAAAFLRGFRLAVRRPPARRGACACGVASALAGRGRRPSAPENTAGAPSLGPGSPPPECAASSAPPCAVCGCPCGGGAPLPGSVGRRRPVRPFPAGPPCRGRGWWAPVALRPPGPWVCPAVCRRARPQAAALAPPAGGRRPPGAACWARRAPRLCGERRCGGVGGCAAAAAPCDGD